MRESFKYFTIFISLTVVILFYQNCGEFSSNLGTDTPTTNNNFDSTAPEDNFKVLESKNTNVTQSSALIQWQTNIGAQSFVTYGPTTDLSLSTSKVLDFNLFNHEHELINLTPNTRYFYQTHSTTDQGVIHKSDVFSFSTLSTEINFTLITQNISDNSITENSVTIGWEVNQPAQGSIKYGLSSTNLNEQTSKELSFRFSVHNQTISNLNSNTKYYYQTESINEAGEVLLSDIQSFTTKDMRALNPSPEPTQGIEIKNSDWNAGRLLNTKFGNHSSDENFKPSQPGDTDSIKITLKKGSHYGSAAYFLFPNKTQEAWVTYCIRIADNWTTSVGGKLPGFSGKSSPANGGQGGARSTGSNAWSARMQYGIYDKTNKAIPLGNYIYHTNAPGKYGDTDWWAPNPSRLHSLAARAKHNRWHKIKQRIKMNSVNKNNGLIEAWFDGKLVYKRNDFNFTNNESFREISRFWLDVYHGGGATSPHDQDVYLDQINYSIGNKDKTSANCVN